ncbi:MAG TPA: endo-1,4-beta-xylanase, partial [Pirellulales bacterium]
KWGNNEASQGSVNMSLVDKQLNYAQLNNPLAIVPGSSPSTTWNKVPMDARMHNLIWGSGATGGNQQPGWVNSLISSAAGGNATAKTNLYNAIVNRINYYVGTNGNRSQKYSEIDVLNEALNNPSYWNIFNPTTSAPGSVTVATIYKNVLDALAATGSNARTYLNEYNVLQFSPSTISSSGVESGSDAYANWYRNEVEAVNNRGHTDFGENVVTGIGMQMYASTTTLPSPATMEKALQNLSVEGLPLTMAEFGLASGTTKAQSQAQGPGILDNALRMIYGTPNATTFMIWGWWDVTGSSSGYPVAAMLDNTSGTGNNTVVTPIGLKWEQLMALWSTHTTVTPDADGNLSFTGYYGTYNLSVGNTVYAVVDHEKGAAPVLWVKGDYNMNGELDNADLQAMLQALKSLSTFQTSMASTEFHALFDVNDDGVVNAADVSAIESLLASGIQAGNGIFGGGGSLSSVPEPARAVFAAICFGLRWCAVGHRRRSV